MGLSATRFLITIRNRWFLLVHEWTWFAYRLIYTLSKTAPENYCCVSWLAKKELFSLSRLVWKQMPFFVFFQSRITIMLYRIPCRNRYCRALQGRGPVYLTLLNVLQTRFLGEIKESVSRPSLTLKRCAPPGKPANSRKLRSVFFLLFLLTFLLP